MFHLHHGNRLETLALACTESFRNDCLSPLASRPILIESPSLGRWLKNHICLYDGVVCLAESELPAAWLWQQARLTLDQPRKDEPLSRERMQWRIHAVLDGAHPAWDDADMDELTAYLADDDTGLKRWQLAGRIADVFDRYQFYRPQLIEDWSAGSNDKSAWQARIWRAISEDVENHRVELMRSFIDTLKTATTPPKLPERLDLFAFHNLPRLFLDAFDAIARHIPVHLWLLSPTDAYWADLATPREMAHRRLKTPGDDSLWQAGNPLLTQWGRQGQVMQDLLLDQDLPLEESDEHFTEPRRSHLLSHLQADIHAAIAEEQSEPVSLQDESPLPSIQIHVCHSPMRECQVLRDEILRNLQADESLQPEDILVMVPEISRYAPFIKAVFSQKSPRLPFLINDTTTADEHPLTRAFLGLLDLPSSRFTRAEILDLLQIPEVRVCFGLDDTADADLGELFDQLHVYWGLDGRDKKKRLGLPNIDENTWHQGIRRLMAGYALGSDHLWDGSAPLPGITASHGEQIARFLDLLQLLRDWATTLDRKRSPEEWSADLTTLLNALFTETRDDDGRLGSIREILANLGTFQYSSPAPLSLAAIRHWLHQQLESESSGNGNFYSGGITFCGMKPLRGVPFKLICLMGMQESAFPRRRTRLEFDLMARDWRHGDPDPSQEDRYLFLETLLATRQRLMISLTGRDIRTDTESPPSVLVQELIDHIEKNYRLPWPLEIKHPLQPFSLRNFGASEDGTDKRTPQPSFDAWWLDIGKAIHTHRKPERDVGWPEPNLELPEGFSREVSIEQLAGLMAIPVRKFIQQRLKIYSPDETSLPDAEPFNLDGLQSWAIKDALLKTWLGGDDSKTEEELRARGMLPHGSHGKQSVKKYKEELHELKELLEPLQGSAPKDFEIDIPLPIAEKGSTEHWRITGRIQHYYPNTGLVHFTASNFKPANLLKLWVEHLCLQAAHETNHASHLFSNAKTKIGKLHTLLPVETTEARNHLKTLLGYYEWGLKSPLPLLPEAAYVYTKTKDKKGEETAKRDAAKKVDADIYPSSNGTPPSDSYYTNLLLRSHQPTFDEACISLAEQIMAPLVEQLDKPSKKEKDKQT